MLLGKEKIPLYCQLAEIIINEIESKGLKENDRLPAEREYSEKYKLSRATVRPVSYTHLTLPTTPYV